jgi:hypothetical protein
VISKPVAEYLIGVLDNPARAMSHDRAVWGLSHHQIAEDAKPLVRDALLKELDESLNPQIRMDAVFYLSTLDDKEVQDRLNKIANDPAESELIRREIKERQR